jgi:hypothetical protein
MTFKLQDKVRSILENKDTGQTGTIILVDSNRNVVVQVDDSPKNFYTYDLDGRSIDNPDFSIRKVE